jgi:hypothetical protein
VQLIFFPHIALRFVLVREAKSLVSHLHWEVVLQVQQAHLHTRTNIPPLSTARNIRLMLRRGGRREGGREGWELLSKTHHSHLAHVLRFGHLLAYYGFLVPA